MSERKSSEWQDVQSQSSDSQTISRRLPAHVAPALARPGMAVLDPDGGCDILIIDTMTEHVAVCRAEDGTTRSVPWPEVSLEVVQPDPACIARAPQTEGSADSPMRAKPTAREVALIVGIGGKNARLAGLDLRGLDLSGMVLDGVTFDKSDMRGCNLRNCSIEGASFYGADLRGADLSDVIADCEDPCFMLADLRGAKLCQATLSEADFEGAKLDEADFTGARIEGADLADATMRSTKFIETAADRALIESEALAAATVEGGSWRNLRAYAPDRTATSAASKTIDYRLQQLWSWGEWLHRHIQQNAPDSDLARALAEALHLSEDGVEPDPDATEAAIDEFLALPMEEQRRLLNGWHPGGEPPTAEQAAPDDLTVSGIVSISSRGTLSADYILDGGIDPAEVRIRRGARREDVIRSLQTAIALVETRWNDVVADPQIVNKELPAADEAAPDAA